MKRLIVIAFLVGACGGATGSVADSKVPIAAVAPSLAPTAAAPAATPTAAPTVAPTPSPEPVDPATALFAWKEAFWAGYGDLYKNNLADVLQSDYVIFSSIDKVEYDKAKNTVRFDITSDYESLYHHRPNELRDDAWEIYRDYGREIWQTVIEGIGSEPAEGVTPDWPKWTPALVFVGDAMRLSCPGSFIVKIAQREATQADFVKACKITS